MTGTSKRLEVRLNGLSDGIKKCSSIEKPIHIYSDTDLYEKCGKEQMNIGVTLINGQPDGESC